MKKLFAVLMTLVMLFGSISLTAFAADQPLTANVYVTIANKGILAVAAEEIVVADRDNNGTLTIDEVLYAAHEAKYEGGAAAGYNSYVHAQYGLSLGKLWGDSSGSYGYYINNVAAQSLADAVQEGDTVSAFVYADLTAWSDTYCWFNVNTAAAKAGEEISLTLSGAGYDANWNPVTVAIANAAITVNGEKSEYKTDTDGKVTLTIDTEGTYVISAISDTQVLVPPVCRVVVSKASAVTTTANDKETSENPTHTADTDTSTGSVSPKTGDDSHIVFFAVLTLVSGGALIALSATKKKSYEK